MLKYQLFTLRDCRVNTTFVSHQYHQVIIALSGGELIYFELNPATGGLVEIEKKELHEDAACLDVAPVPAGRQRCRCGLCIIGAMTSSVACASARLCSTICSWCAYQRQIRPAWVLCSALLATGTANRLPCVKRAAYGNQKSLRRRFLAVGSYDSTVRILNLDPEDCLKVLALQVRQGIRTRAQLVTARPAPCNHHKSVQEHDSGLLTDALPGNEGMCTAASAATLKLCQLLHGADACMYFVLL